MSQSASWYSEALRRIQALAIPLDTPPDEERRLLREAYPWGERRYWPYKSWLRAVKDWRAERARLRAFTVRDPGEPLALTLTSEDA